MDYCSLIYRTGLDYPAQDLSLSTAHLCGLGAAAYAAHRIWSLCETLWTPLVESSEKKTRLVENYNLMKEYETNPADYIRSDYTTTDSWRTDYTRYADPLESQAGSSGPWRSKSRRRPRDFEDEPDVYQILERNNFSPLSRWEMLKRAFAAAGFQYEVMAHGEQLHQEAPQYGPQYYLKFGTFDCDFDTFCFHLAHALVNDWDVDPLFEDPGIASLSLTVLHRGVMRFLKPIGYKGPPGAQQTGSSFASEKSGAKKKSETDQSVKDETKTFESSKSDVNTTSPVTIGTSGIRRKPITSEPISSEDPKWFGASPGFCGGL